LCETVRTARGPRQRIVASLGKRDAAQVGGLKDGWDDLPALLRGEQPVASLTTATLPGIEPAASDPPRHGCAARSGRHPATGAASRAPTAAAS